LLRDRLRKRVPKAYELRSRKDVRELAGCFGTLLVGGEEDRQKAGLGLDRLPEDRLFLEVFQWPRKIARRDVAA